VPEFGRVYFPDYVPNEYSKFHMEWEKIQLLESTPVLPEIFRGSGKSTFFTLLNPIYNIACGKRNFINFLSYYNEEKSMLFTGRILFELLYNQHLINDFGKFINKVRSVGIGNFTAGVPDSSGRLTGVRAISIGQDPHGFVFWPSHPDYVRLDDIQSRKRSKSGKFVCEHVE